jgi:uncharacterized protein (UPF0332 family)
MKKINFLVKLKKEKKIQIIEPSEEVCRAYLEKSEKSLRSAKVTLEIRSYEDSVALSYYSMYYNVLALFYKVGIKCENHTATIILLKKIFNIDNIVLTKAKTERVDKQYYVDFSVTEEEVNKMIRMAEQFNADLFNFIDTLNKDKIGEYRQKAIQVLKWKN